MPSLTTRSTAAALAVGLLAAVPVLASTSSPASAATSTRTVTYERCDVRTAANDPGTRVGPVFSWSPTVTVDMHTPVEVNKGVDGRVAISDFPADKVPALSKVYMYFTGQIATSTGGTYTFGKTLPLSSTIEAGKPIPLGESEKEYTFGKPGLINWFADQFTANVEGYDGPNGTGDWHRYYVKCDAPVTSQLIASVPVWDPAAKAALALSTPTVVQGRTVTLRGSGFRPDEAVKYTLAGKELKTYATSLIGEVSHTWAAPAFAKPGAYKVTLTSTISQKTVSGTVTVVAAPAKASVNVKKIKRGKKVTVSGAQFQPGESVSVVLKRAVAGKGLKSKSYGTVKVSSSGRLTKKLKVVKKFGKGKHTVVLTGSSSKRVGTVNLTVKVPKKK